MLANCLTHGRRQFVDVLQSFPEECSYVPEILAEVYKNDKITKEQNMEAEERLRFHQDNSGPLMKKLNTWFHKQIDQHLVEPNSGLGQAIGYMLKHWEALTLFLKGTRCTFGQQYLRTGFEKGHSASQECSVL